MKKQWCFLLLFIFAYITSPAQLAKTVVFESGKEGHKSYRIPAIIKLNSKELLAFCEGRVNGAADLGDINIVMKRSADKGKTWSSLQTIVDLDNLQAGNPAPVVDLADPAYPKGRIFLFYNTGNNHEDEIRKGKGLREVWYTSSVDAGVTWSVPANITLQVHRPLQPNISGAYNFKADWRSYANTPGHALQIKNGKYAGRIFVAANHSEGDPKTKSEDYFAHGYYTDDHGKTFHLSETVNRPGGNEATAAEISGNAVILNARNQKGDIKARIVARSKDGGETWKTVVIDKNLPDPVCEGSLLNIGSKKGKQILAFCNAADTMRRNNLAVRISYDEGNTWKWKIPVDASEDRNKDYTAYADLVLIGKKNIGVLYERDNYKTIVFTVVNFRVSMKQYKR